MAAVNGFPAPFLKYGFWRSGGGPRGEGIVGDGPAIHKVHEVSACVTRGELSVWERLEARPDPAKWVSREDHDEALRAGGDAAGLAVDREYARAENAERLLAEARARIAELEAPPATDSFTRTPDPYVKPRLTPEEQAVLDAVKDYIDGPALWWPVVDAWRAYEATQSKEADRG